MRRRAALFVIVSGVLGVGAASWGQTKAPTWPNTISINGASAVVYQPQAIEWPEHKTLSTREAVAITRVGDKAPILGTTEISFSTETDAASGEVILTHPNLTASHFPSLDTAQAAAIEEHIKAALPNIHLRPVPLQSILLSLEQTAQPQSVPVNNDPPEIIYSDKPASLVVFDGQPVMVPVDTTGLSVAVNTNWDVFSDGQAWYLLNNGVWMMASAFDGPYHPVLRLPPAFGQLPADANFASVRKAIPPRQTGSVIAPAVFVRTEPTDIIVTGGPPQFVPVMGTGLQSVKNTASTLFFEPASGRFFLLISGRWFASQGLHGPWTFATNDLPPDFALIPPNDPEAKVLASVPGTSQAQLALLQAQVPKQATLKKAAAKLSIVYAGAPQFKPIPGTSMTYAVNTSYQVIETGGHYYACYQGAWFDAPSPNGPWILAASVPKVIYTIPPSSPMYNVTYVRVYAATPVAVTYGYTAGYLMGFVTSGVVVYGTGYYYPPVVIPGPVPVYYPYPYSYVGNVAYNPATGAWAQGGTIYGPYGGVARGGTAYNPATGAYATAGAIYGPNGGAGAFSAYNPSTGSYAHGSASWSNGSGSANASYYNARTGVTGTTNQNANPYSRWGSSTFAGPSQTVNTQSASNSRGSAGAFQSSTGAQGAGYSGANGNRGGAVKTQNGDVYAGHDGNAYQHTSDGWSKWSNGGWQPVDPPSNAHSTTAATQAQRTSAQTQRPSTGSSRTGARPTMENSSYQQLERDRQARFAGGSQRFGGAGGGGARFRR